MLTKIRTTIRYAISLCTAAFLLGMCSTQNKVEYTIGTDVSEANKKLFIERAEKGRILFKEHCSGCHGIYSKGKDGVPNFTKQQIDDYHARSVIAFKSHTSVRDLSPQQLDYVLTFLRLRKVQND